MKDFIDLLDQFCIYHGEKVKEGSASRFDRLETLVLEYFASWLNTNASQPAVQDGQAKEPTVECDCTPNRYCKAHGGGKPPVA